MALPVPDVARSAREYKRAAGVTTPEAPYHRAVITAPAAKAVAAGYNALPSHDDAALPAYHAMRTEVGRQFDHMTSPRSRGGLGLSVGVTPHDPYGAEGYHSVFKELAHDVTENNHVNVLSTRTTGGHPFFSNDENDMFRAVHDVYGHLGSGRGVDFDGEEAAYQKHSRMFSPLARRAMATETRGQNSYLREHGDFPEQKVGLLPDHLQGLQFSRIGAASDLVNAMKRARSKNAEQGL